MISPSELRKIADWQNGLVSPAIHFNEQVYLAEQERIFGRAWLVVGHEDMVGLPGDYITNYMGEVPVIVLRDGDGTIRVLVNRCAHRGNQVCLFDRGNVRSFTCSYHGWTYGLDGSLAAVPMEKELYRGDLNKAEWGLEQAPRVANFHGLIFASFDAEVAPIEDWLGEDAGWWLRHFVLAEPVGGLEALPGFHRYHSPGNWKLISENFIGDDYHVFAATHTAWLRLNRQFQEQGLRIPMTTYPSGGADRRPFEASAGYAPLGLGVVVVDESMYQRDLDEAGELGADAVEWVTERWRRYNEALQDREVKPYSFMNGCLFPNLGLMGFSSPMVGRHFLHFHPRSPLDHEVWQWTMVEREAPQSVKDLAVQRVYQGQHMAGIVAPDDVENFERMLETMRPARNWRRPFHYRMQLGHEGEGPQGLPGRLGPNPSEVNQRQFYRFWTQLMERD